MPPADELTLLDVLKAAQAVYRHLRPTPLYHYAGLSELIGAQVWVKHENHLPTGAFKIRGGINLATLLSERGDLRGLATASTGNHGQSIAFAGQLLHIPALVAMPEGANPGKVARIRSFGAEIAFIGPDYDTAREWVITEAQRRGYQFVGPADAALIAGVGTYALEILQELPDVEAILTPVGGGSGAAGVCLVAKALNPAIQVIGVQAEQAPAAYRAWKSGQPATASAATFAEGLATRTTFETSQVILRRYLDDFVLVSEQEIRRAILIYLQETHDLAEGAGATPLAAALKLKERLQGKKVVLVLSGGNLSLAQLREVLAACPQET